MKTSNNLVFRSTVIQTAQIVLTLSHLKEKVAFKALGVRKFSKSRAFLKVEENSLPRKEKIRKRVRKKDKKTLCRLDQFKIQLKKLWGSRRLVIIKSLSSNQNPLQIKDSNL